MATKDGRSDVAESRRDAESFSNALAACEPGDKLRIEVRDTLAPSAPWYAGTLIIGSATKDFKVMYDDETMSLYDQKDDSERNIYQAIEFFRLEPKKSSRDGSAGEEGAVVDKKTEQAKKDRKARWAKTAQEPPATAANATTASQGTVTPLPHARARTNLTATPQGRRPAHCTTQSPPP